MTQIEQWFSILQGKRWRISDFSDLDHLAKRTMAFVLEAVCKGLGRELREGRADKMAWREARQSLVLGDNLKEE
jgi:hypothetical protein